LSSSRIPLQCRSTPSRDAKRAVASSVPSDVRNTRRPPRCNDVTVAAAFRRPLRRNRMPATSTPSSSTLNGGGASAPSPGRRRSRTT
jgi:hypothetical protein